MKNIHATCIALNNKGILLLGPSGAGKSDLALRAIEQLGAVLVADDRTDIEAKTDGLYASCPNILKNLLEVRGIGIIKKKALPIIKIHLVIELTKDYVSIERLPKKDIWKEEGVEINKIHLYPFELSAVYKLKLACDELR